MQSMGVHLHSLAGWSCNSSGKCICAGQWLPGWGVPCSASAQSSRVGPTLVGRPGRPSAGAQLIHCNNFASSSKSFLFLICHCYHHQRSHSLPESEILMTFTGVLIRMEKPSAPQLIVWHYILLGLNLPRPLHITYKEDDYVTHNLGWWSLRWWQKHSEWNISFKAGESLVRTDDGVCA